ncbi:hypothetical protein WR25_17481 [Diploscapter pachys]|uniref:MARVEL domain-containing protein n=1 Tax=Diploscapter pachys TaxID=2018661 RepID=A0A2A2L6B0_9BILA|nr:hypothetical protein WR25_17481 [Diploscapter pachys]
MNGTNRKSETYVTQQPDGTTVTTTTKTQTKVKEERVWRCGRGNTDKYYCMGPHGILRLIEIFLCLVIICLISSVYGPGPFKGVLFGQTILLIVAGVALVITFIFLIAYFFTLNETHLHFYCWRESDIVFSITTAIMLFVLAILEAYYSTGSWSNNCNDIGSDGIIHNGCRIIYEWAFAAFVTFVLALCYAASALLAFKDRHNTYATNEYKEYQEKEYREY